MGAAALLSPLSTTDAQAVDVNKLSEEQLQEACARDASTESASIQAFQHSLCHREIGVVVTGHTDDFSGDQIGQIIVNEFAKRGIAAKAFVRSMPDGATGFAVSFALKGVVYGPFGEDWATGFKQVHAQFPQAWAAAQPANVRG